MLKKYDVSLLKAVMSLSMLFFIYFFLKYSSKDVMKSLGVPSFAIPVPFFLWAIAIGMQWIALKSRHKRGLEFTSILIVLVGLIFDFIIYK